MAICQTRELDVVSRDHLSRIGHWARGLVDISEVKLCAIGSSIVLKKMDIVLKD